MKLFLLVFAFISLFNSIIAQTPDYDKEIRGMWDGAGFSGPQKDIIMGKVIFGLNGFGQTGGFNVTIKLSTPSQMNKSCEFVFEAKSINDISIQANKVMPYFSSSSICATGIDDKNNINYQDVPPCFETIKMKFVKKNNRTFLVVLLSDAAKHCESKLFFWRSNSTQDESNLYNLFVSYEKLQQFHDSVSKKSGIDINNDNGAYDQQYIRSKINDNKVTMEYFTGDELLLIKPPFLATFALHLTMDEYLQVNPSGKLRFVNSIVRKDELFLQNAMIMGLFPDKPVFFPDRSWYQKSKQILKKYTPGILENDPVAY